MNPNGKNRAEHRTITVHLHQPTPPLNKGDFLRGGVPLVWFVLGYLLGLLSR